MKEKVTIITNAGSIDKNIVPAVPRYQVSRLPL